MKTILITGGTGMIASVQVKHLLSCGHRVVVTYRDEAKFRSLGDCDGLVGIHTPDLLAEHALDDLVRRIDELHLRPDCLVNHAGDVQYSRMEEDGHVPEDCFIGHYRFFVVVPYELSWQLVHMPGSRLRKIINISSMYGMVPHNPALYERPDVQTPLQYGVAKAAMLHLTKDLAIRFRDKGVFVNAISYGGVEGRVDDEFKRRLAEVTPLGRMMTVEETIPALDFLLNEESGYMTGHNLVVDGGRTIW